MAEIVRPGSDEEFRQWMLNVDRRLNNVETARRLPQSDLRDGALNVLTDDGRLVASLGVQPDGKVAIITYDASGNERVRMGELSTGGSGISVVTPDGRPLFLVNEDAQQIPWSILVFVPWVGIGAAGMCWLDTVTFSDFMAATQLVTAPFFHWNVFVDTVSSSASADWRVQATIAGTSGWVTVASGVAAAGTAGSFVGAVDLRTTGLGSDIVGRNVDYRVQLKRNGGTGLVGFRFNFPAVLRPTG